MLMHYIHTVEPRTPLGSNILSVIARCPYPGASGIFSVGVVLLNRAVEYNVAVFSELSFAVCS